MHPTEIPLVSGKKEVDRQRMREWEFRMSFGRRKGRPFWDVSPGVPGHSRIQCENAKEIDPVQAGAKFVCTLILKQRGPTRNQTPRKYSTVECVLHCEAESHQEADYAHTHLKSRALTGETCIWAAAGPAVGLHIPLPGVNPLHSEIQYSSYSDQSLLATLLSVRQPHKTASTSLGRVS